MAFIWRLRGNFIIKARAAILDPFFGEHLKNHYTAFLMAENKHTYPWGKDISEYVSGKSPGGRMKAAFLSNVDVLYIPMKWGHYHWVGLVINMLLRSVEVYDPFMIYTSDSAVALYIAPIIECLPIILKSCLPPALNAELPTTPYTWTRIQNIYQNRGGGDCGPVAAKFLEIHAAGLGVNEMSDITDDDVERFREKYAMDCFEAFCV